MPFQLKVGQDLVSRLEVTLICFRTILYAGANCLFMQSKAGNLADLAVHGYPLVIKHICGKIIILNGKIHYKW